MSSLFFFSRSRMRKNLLSLLFKDTDKKYYLREFERLLNHSAGSIRRELILFKNEGLLSTEKVGNLIFYRVNYKYPFFDELRNIIRKSLGVSYSLSIIFKKMRGIRYAFSIIDINATIEKKALIFVIGDASPEALKRNVVDVEHVTGIEFDFTIIPQERLRLDAARNKAGLADAIRASKVMIIGTEEGIKKLALPQLEFEF